MMQPPLSCPTWSRLQPQLLWAYRQLRDAETARRISMESEFNELTVWKILRGRVTLKTVSEERVFQAGDLLIPPTGRRRQEFEGPLELMSVGFKCLWEGGQAAYRVPKAQRIRGAAAETLEVSFNHLIEIVTEETQGEFWSLLGRSCDAVQWLKIQQSFSGFLLNFQQVAAEIQLPFDTPKAEDLSYLMVKRRLDQWPVAKKLDLDALARDAGQSRRQVERLFQKHLGTSPLKAYEQRRREVAVALLSQKDQLIKQVALKMGFVDAANFCRWFQNQFGQNPRSYQETLIRLKIPMQADEGR